MKSDLHPAVVPTTASSDLIVLRVQDLFIVNVYFPPATSTYLQNMDPPFEQSLQEALALLGAQEDSTIIVVGDLNGRTAVHTATTDSPIRQSPDLVAANQRGRSILQWAADNALEIVNGTEWQTTDFLDRFASHRPAGLAVVDYVLVSMAALRESRISSLHVGNRNRAWSDHAPLLFSVQLRADSTLR